MWQESQYGGITMVEYLLGWLVSVCLLCVRVTNMWVIAMDVRYNSYCNSYIGGSTISVTVHALIKLIHCVA